MGFLVMLFALFLARLSLYIYSTTTRITPESLFHRALH